MILTSVIAYDKTESLMPRPTPHTTETAAPMVHALSHSYAANFPLVTMEYPIFAP